MARLIKDPVENELLISWLRMTFPEAKEEIRLKTGSEFPGEVVDARNQARSSHQFHEKVRPGKRLLFPGTF